MLWHHASFGVSVSSSYGYLAHFLAMASPKCSFDTAVSYGVGLLNLCPTPNLEDYDLIFGFTPLGGLAPL